MDIACSIRQPNVWFCGERTSYKKIDRFHSHTLLRNRDFRTGLRPSTNKNAKKAVCLGGVENPGFVATREKYAGQRLSLSPEILSFCGFRSASKVRGSIRSRCQNGDALNNLNGAGPNPEFSESSDESGSAVAEQGEESEEPSLEELREILHKAVRDLEVARLNSTMFEEKAQKISETAIALQDEATNARNEVDTILDAVQKIVNEESIAKEALQKATMALSFAEARLRVSATESVDGSEVSGPESDVEEDEKALLAAREEIQSCMGSLASCEAELMRVQDKKEELQREVDRLNEVAERVQLNALKAEEEVANIMLLAEQAVAFELEASQRVNDAEIALQKAEKSLSNSEVVIAEPSKGQVLNTGDGIAKEERVVRDVYEDVVFESDLDVMLDGDSSAVKPLPNNLPEKFSNGFEEPKTSEYLSEGENGKLGLDALKEAEAESERSKNIAQSKALETPKDLKGDSPPSPKALLKKSSRFFSASFFSSTEDGSEFTPGSIFQSIMETVRNEGPKVIFGLVLAGAGYVLLFITFSIQYFVPMMSSSRF